MPEHTVSLSRVIGPFYCVALLYFTVAVILACINVHPSWTECFRKCGHRIAGIAWSIACIMVVSVMVRISLLVEEHFSLYVCDATVPSYIESGSVIEQSVIWYCSSSGNFIENEESFGLICHMHTVLEIQVELKSDWTHKRHSIPHPLFSYLCSRNPNW